MTVFNKQEYDRKRYLENREKVLERVSRYNREHRKQLNEYQHRYYRENKERLNKYRQKLRKNNREKPRVYCRIQAHPERYSLDVKCAFCDATKKLEHGHLDYEDEGHNYLTVCSSCNKWMEKG